MHSQDPAPQLHATHKVCTIALDWCIPLSRSPCLCSKCRITTSPAINAHGNTGCANFATQACRAPTACSSKNLNLAVSASSLQLVTMALLPSDWHLGMHCGLLLCNNTRTPAHIEQDKWHELRSYTARDPVHGRNGLLPLVFGMTVRGAY